MPNPVYKTNCGWVFHLDNIKSVNFYKTQEEAWKAFRAYLAGDKTIEIYEIT